MRFLLFIVCCLLVTCRAWDLCDRPSQRRFDVKDVKTTLHEGEHDKRRLVVNLTGNGKDLIPPTAPVRGWLRLQAFRSYLGHVYSTSNDGIQVEFEFTLPFDSSQAEIRVEALGFFCVDKLQPSINSTDNLTQLL